MGNQVFLGDPFIGIHPFFHNQALIYYPSTFPIKLENIVEFALPFLGWLLILFLPFLYFFVTVILCGFNSHLLVHIFRCYVFLKANTPFPFQILRQLINSPIGKSDNQWRLINLSASELAAMREWARDNREGTDKRVVPATLFIAIYGIFASTEPFTNFTTSLTGILLQRKMV